MNYHQEAGLLKDEISQIDDALAGLDENVIAPIVQNCRNAEINLPDAMIRRYSTLSEYDCMIKVVDAR